MKKKPDPLLKRVLDQPLVLLALGLVVMLVFYTLWGLVEVLMLPESMLP